MIKKRFCWQKYRKSSKFIKWGHNSGNIHGENCIFERSNKRKHFSKTKVYFHKKTTPQLLGHIGLQNMKVGVKANFGWLAAVCVMHVDIISFKNLKVISWGKKGKAKHFYPSKKSVIMGLFMRLNLPRVSYRSVVERPLAQIGRSTFESYQEHLSFFSFFSPSLPVPFTE